MLVRNNGCAAGLAGNVLACEWVVFTASNTALRLTRTEAPSSLPTMEEIWLISASPR